MHQSLPFLLHHLQAGALAGAGLRPALREAVRGYCARHGTPAALEAWLGFELRQDRVPAQIAVARLLAAAPLSWEEGLCAWRRATLTALMLTGSALPAAPARAAHPKRAVAA